VFFNTVSDAAYKNSLVTQSSGRPYFTRAVLYSEYAATAWTNEQVDNEAEQNYKKPEAEKQEDSSMAHNSAGYSIKDNS